MLYDINAGDIHIIGNDKFLNDFNKALKDQAISNGQPIIDNDMINKCVSDMSANAYNHKLTTKRLKYIADNVFKDGVSIKPIKFK